MLNFKDIKKIWIVLGSVLIIQVLGASAQQSHQHEQDERNQIRREEQTRNRWQWQMPHRVMDELGITEGMVVGDVGAGDGYFAFRLTDRVGGAGKVYASDIDNRALQVIRDKCRAENITNLSVILGTETDPKLPEQSLDKILMVNVIHLVDNLTPFLKNVAKSLKPEASLVIVQWDEEKMGKEQKDWDPADRAKYSLRTNLRMIYGAGFEVTRILDFLPLQKIYICVPAGN
jgi:ubiquinone/menaquinone biosynthesis C-methylase UbiE